MFEFNGTKYYTRDEWLDMKIKKLSKLEVELSTIAKEIVSEVRKLEQLVKEKNNEETKNN